jgi:predicted TIM-barrel fold metal-dependent hydrolase
MVEYRRFGTQPIEKPPTRRDLFKLIEWMRGEGTLVHAGDFPHWDWDDPTRVLRGLDPATWRRIFAENARELYRRTARWWTGPPNPRPEGRPRRAGGRADPRGRGWT